MLGIALTLFVATSTMLALTTGLLFRARRDIDLYRATLSYEQRRALNAEQRLRDALRKLSAA